ncbi:hypothetical protein BGZ80_005173, partial [Entomortierella chlamydospora]
MPPKRHGEGSVSIIEGISLKDKREAMSQILDRLENFTDKSGRLISELFLELPDREEYPDYYLTIKNPIAFDIIRDKLDSGLYDNENIVNFSKDLLTLTSNAKEYNRKGSPIHRDAMTLEAQIELAMQFLLEDGSQQDEQEPFTTEFCHRVLKTIKNHKDESGRLMSELFLELPSHEEYPDYYEEITRPIALDGIKKKINSGAYKNLESFEDDFELMFENAKQYNAEGSDVYLDAEELQQLFWKEIGKDGRGNTKNKHARKHVKELTQVSLHGGIFKVGDFVHLKNDRDPSKPIIALIFSLWEDENGQTGLDATWFLRPDQIVHPYASRFYPSEVLKASGSHEHLVSEIQDKCYVLYTRDYVRGRPIEWNQNQSIYLCEQRYNEAYKSVSKIKNWASCLPPGHKPSDMKLNLFPEPLVLKKLPSASMVDKAGRHDSEGPSRSSTPQDTSSRASAGGHKRNSLNQHPGSPPMAMTHQAQQVAPHHWVRCNYSSLSTGLQCSGVFPNQAELQRHVATEHALIQHVAAPPAMKRGRPRKNPLPATAATPTPGATQVSAPQQPMMNQQGAYPQQSFNPYNPAGQFGVPPRPGMPGQVMQPNMPYPQQPQPQPQPQAMHHMQQQQQQQQQRGMPYQQPFSQPLQQGQPRPQAYPQNVPYGQP